MTNEDCQFTVKYDDEPSDAVDNIRDILEPMFGLTIVELERDDDVLEDMIYQIKKK